MWPKFELIQTCMVDFGKKINSLLKNIASHQIQTVGPVSAIVKASSLAFGSSQVR